MSRYEGIPFDPAKFQELKAEHGTYTALSICYRDSAMHRIDEAKTVEDLKPILKMLLLNTSFTYEGR